MPTLREVVSRIRSQFKLVSSDGLLTDRAIAAELRSTATKFIKRETDKRKLWSSPNLFTQVECIELIEVPLAECCDFVSDCTVRRSKYKIPKIAEGLYGLLVQAVFSIDKRTRFKETSPVRYGNLLKIGLPSTSDYFWIYNGYLYLSDKDLESVTLSAYFEEDIPLELKVCNPDCTDSCPDNPLDLPFRCPGYLEADVVSFVITVLSNTYKRSSEDLTSDGKDDYQ